MKGYAELQKPFNFQRWIDDNARFLKPPVSNRLVFDNAGMVIQVIGGPNQRVDFHDDPVEEFFYQLKGDMVLKVHDNGEIHDIPVREGDVFLLPPHVRHSPQRPEKDSIGLVVEGNRTPDMLDGFEWYCFNCCDRVHRVELKLRNIVKDLPPLFESFYDAEDQRTCSNCGTVHPGKVPPEDWLKQTS